MGILVSFVSVLFSRNILELLNTPQDIFDDALLYTRIVCGGIIAVVMYNGIAAMLQSLGDSTTPLIFLVVASVLNVIGDLLLVVVFHMGWPALRLRRSSRSCSQLWGVSCMR